MGMAQHKNGLMAIGQAAKAVGVAPSALRYYERQSLVAPSARSRAGYRLYLQEDVDRLKFVRSAQAVGFALDDIRLLLDFLAADRKSCRAEVRRLIEERLAEVDTKMKDLRKVRKTLGQALDRCSRSRDECMVLKDLSSGKTNRRKS